MSGFLYVVVILRVVLSPSLPLRYSATEISRPSPLTSWKPACGLFGSTPKSTTKLNWLYGRSRKGIDLPPPRLERLLADAEDHELRRPQRGHADEAHEAPVVEVVLRHRAAVADDEVGLLRRDAEQMPELELVEQEVLDGAADIRPQLRAVRL